MSRTSRLLVFLFIAAFVACQNSTKKVVSNDSHLGEISFKVSGNEAAQSSFIEGMLLLHSFEYEDSRTAFLKAQKSDPEMAMAYWGEAMTHNHALWQQQDKDAAIEALEKLAPNREARMALVPTQVEKDFFEGAEILFGDGTKYERDLAYRDHMEQLSKKYKDNNEASAFYAISLLGASRNGRDAELYGKSAQIAKGIIKENPNHPGALHYLIHSYDDPEHAHLAKEAADNYAKVAPDAAHALHMPSHIYVALGLWDEVVSSNIGSWNASVKRMKRKELDGNAKSYHAYRWLHYGLLQKGEYQKANEMLNQMVGYVDEAPNNNARGYLIGMKGAQLVESNMWDSPEADIEIDLENHGHQAKSGFLFIDGLKAYHQEDAIQLASVIENHQALSAEAANNLDPMGFPMCSSGGRPTTKLGVSIMKIKELELQGYLEALNGNRVKAIEHFEQGCKMDENISYSYGPPTIFKPIHEAYAEWLFEQGDYQKALEYFDKSLDRNPRRLLSLKGKKASAVALDQQEVIVSVDKEIQNCLMDQEREVVL
ncbi:MAG: tetratricopeptide repeat protein [Bacteroidia bacterium]|nr:tetratricopeptide repeat protein [Bacteroidia bacterium]